VLHGRAANRSAQNNDLVIQRIKLKFGQRAFFRQNQLPTELKTTKNTAAFKRKLKTYFFYAAYTPNNITLFIVL